MAKLDDLKFVRTYEFTYIPHYLFEQTKEMDSETIKRVYAFNSFLANSPTTLLYVMLTELHEIKGVLWVEIDIVEAKFFIRLLSVDKEYQSIDGQLMNKVKDFLFSLDTGPALKKELQFLTIHPHAYEKVGVTQSKRVLMEITDDTNNTKRDNGSDTGGTE